MGEAVHLSLIAQLWKKYIVADFVAHTARSPFRSSQRIHRVLNKINTSAKVKLSKRHTVVTKTDTEVWKSLCLFSTCYNPSGNVHLSDGAGKGRGDSSQANKEASRHDHRSIAKAVAQHCRQRS